MSSKPTPPQGVNLLKELLFERENQRLDELAGRLEADQRAAKARDTALNERLDSVFERAGSEERLLHAVAGIIDGALREAEIARHEPLSKAIAPLIVRTIKVQLRESQDEMVDALYPITGRLVKSYVQAEINRLMIEINAKLGGGRPALAARSAATGVSPGELALAEANSLAVEEIFLLHRGSGDLIAHWEKPEPGSDRTTTARAGGSNRDVLISGYISGIMTFSEEAFGAKPGSFRTLELESGDRIFVRGSAAHLLAVRCSGTSQAAAEPVIDEVFLDTLERYQKLLANEGGKSVGDEQNANSRNGIAALLPTIARTIEDRTAPAQSALVPGAGAAAQKPSFARLYALAALIAAPFVVGGAWWAYLSFETLRTESAANRVIETMDEISDVPPRIEVTRGGRTLTLTGFVSSAALRDKIVTRLGEDVPQAVVRNQLVVMPTGKGEVEAALAAFRRNAEQQRRDAAAAAVARSVGRIQQRLEPLRATMTRLERERGVTLPAAWANLAQALDAALEQSKQPITTRDADPDKLVRLWQSLSVLDRQLSGVMGVAAAQSSASARPAEMSELAEDVSLLAERIGAVGSGLTIVDRLTPTSRAGLEQFIRVNALFFDNGTDFRDQALATSVLDQLTSLLRDNPGVLLRVVGYTDERGGQLLNTNLAQQRADRVMTLLTDRGIAAGRLVAVGRLAAKDLSRSVGPGSANRRVEFEIGFPGEPGGAP